MTKAEIIDAVYEKVGGFSKKEAAEVVEAVFDTMKFRAGLVLVRLIMVPPPEAW